MIIELRREKTPDILASEYETEEINDFPGMDEPNSKMGLGHKIVHSGLFSKWVKKMMLIIVGIKPFVVIGQIIIITILLSSGSGMIWHLSLQSTILHVDSEEVKILACQAKETRCNSVLI